MSKNLFVTGTGTDVGKTYVSGLLLKKAEGERLPRGLAPSTACCSRSGICRRSKSL